MYEPKPLPFKKALIGISEKTLAIHHDKLYQGYVNKKNEIGDKLYEFSHGKKDLSLANQSYSELRRLKTGKRLPLTACTFMSITSMCSAVTVSLRGSLPRR